MQQLITIISNKTKKPIVETYLNLKRRVFRTVIASAAISLTAGVANAQTCRVNIGVNEQGIRSYIEVFEYDFVPEKPCFPGGEEKLMEFIKQTRRYPKDAYDKGIQGRVTCSFVVNADGSVSHISVLRSVNVMLNEEAMRIFDKMPDWSPGKIDGQPVPVRVIRSVTFRK